jgi:hypothetical protein
MIFYELWKQKKYIDSSLTTCFCKFLNFFYLLLFFSYKYFIDVYRKCYAESALFYELEHAAYTPKYGQD